jgi:lantibiotic modifying enzyme
MTTVSFRVDDDRARPGQPSNGLFRGEAGIAYGLLRCAGAGGLPSVLSLDPLEAKA